MAELETCYFCGQAKPAAVYLRDEKGDHPVCQECHEEWADSDAKWPQKTHKKKLVPLGAGS